MMKEYSPGEIEPRWQEKWEEAHIFETTDPKPGEEKAYILDMFPYPSGDGLHVGHLLGYTGSDVLARLSRMQGKKVLHPMGWDAFGLPAENYALKTGIHPAISTVKNTEEYKRQFRQTGISYDWSREINTSTPEYYRWTQWLFLFLYKKGLAYRKVGLVNWCPNDQTVLANEQVIGGKCDRCGAEVVQRQLKQWYFKITDYADRLLDDLDTIDWPEKIKAMQRNWIGRSEGAVIPFATESNQVVEVFSTRPDTIYGATYLVLAPEHPLMDSLMTLEQRESIMEYRESVSHKSELERMFTDREKTGVWTGSYALNPANQEKIPIWIADYVLSTYGTGAIMGVPGHDARDYDFAKTYNLPIVQVVSTEDNKSLPSDGIGFLMNSGSFDGEPTKEGSEVSQKIIDYIGAKSQITYRLRDWLVSRQRFWGTPIPIAYDAQGQEYPLSESELPLELPMNVKFSPTGQSPLVYATEWKSYVKDGKTLHRETDTLDGFVCSSWYYLRYPSPHSTDAAFDRSMVDAWLPVDTYLGGAEHAVLHLLYARFITKVLYDAGLISFTEPFTNLRNQGMILGPDHNKMSKSKGNVINPDEVIVAYGADTLRLYELFMGPFDQEKPWNITGIVGVRRFLEKVWKLQEKPVADASENELRVVHLAIKKVTGDIQNCHFNTAISTLMEMVNVISAQPSIAADSYRALVLLLSPFAPHIAEELWMFLGGTGFASVATWPHYDERYLTVDTISYPVQINGKVRATVTVSGNMDEVAIQALALAEPTLQKYLEGQEIRKVVIVPGKIISLVVGS